MTWTVMYSRLLDIDLTNTKYFSGQRPRITHIKRHSTEEMDALVEVPDMNCTGIASHEQPCTAEDMSGMARLCQNGGECIAIVTGNARDLGCKWVLLYNMISHFVNWGHWWIQVGWGGVRHILNHPRGWAKITDFWQFLSWKKIL